MATYDCEICRGLGLIRLPVYRAPQYTPAGVPPIIDDSSRTFPCPECSETVALDRVAVVDLHSEMDNRLVDDPDFRLHVARRQSSAIGAEMLKQGLISVRLGRLDEGNMTRAVRASAAVVSQTVVASMEERIAARQEDLAREVISVATAKINHYDSYSARESVPKGVAREALAEALKLVLKRRAASRAEQAA